MAETGHKVTLIVADEKGSNSSDGVSIVDVGSENSRLGRVLRSTRKVFECAASLDVDIYILHDPELLPFGLQLRRLGKKVIFDSHEDVAKQVLGKPYLSKLPAIFLSTSYQQYEQYVCRRLDGIVGATPFIREKFTKINRRTIDINNYPILDEFNARNNWSAKTSQACYVGNISAIRGINEMVQACSLLRSPITLNLAGAFETPALAAEVAKLPGWRRVKALGHLDRAGVRDVMARSICGLVTLHPQINYLDALPVKMFEYMAAGIPVIASNFPVWRKIIEDNACGICVDPMSPTSIAEGIDFLASHPDQAIQMGINGRQAVMEKYNWRCESQKMLDFYDNL